MLVLLMLGRLTTLDGVFLVLGYFVYLAVCLSTRSKNQGSSSGGGAFHPLATTAAPSGYRNHPRTGTSTHHINDDFASEINDEMTEAELEMVPFTLQVVHDPGSPAQHAQQQRYPASPMTPKRSGPSLNPLNPGPVSKVDPNLRPRPPAIGNFHVSNGNTHDNGNTNGINTTNNGSSSNTFNGGNRSSEIYPEDPELAPVLPPLNGFPPCRTQSGLMWGSGGAKNTLLHWWREFPETLDDTLHLHGKSGFRRYFTYATAPLILCMHATMPAISSGTFSMAYAGVMSIVAPPFFLVFASAGPGRLGLGAFRYPCAFDPGIHRAFESYN